MEGLLSRAGSPERRRELEEELAVPDIPTPAAYLWNVFLRLHSRRSANEAGPAPLSWVEIAAFSKLLGINFSPWEIGVLEALDDVYLTEQRNAMRNSLEEARARRTEQLRNATHG